MTKQEYFQKQLDRSIIRRNSRPKEPRYLKDYLYTLIAHIRDLKKCNPGISKDDMDEILKSEIATYSKAVFGSSFAFHEYMEYICNRYLIDNPKKFSEISESIRNSKIDFENLNYADCTCFDEYLSLFVYTFKKYTYQYIFNGFKEGSPDRYKNLDEEINEDKKAICTFVFDTLFTLPQVSKIICTDTLNSKAKFGKLKEMSNWYKSGVDRKNFMETATLFLNGSSAFLPKYLKETESFLRKELAFSIETIVTQLDLQGHLSDYVSAYVLQMCNIGFQEFVAPICTSGMPSKEYLDSIRDFNSKKKKNNIKSIIDLDKVKTYLSSDYLTSNKELSIESLLALHSFWLNRYAKELDLYAEAMFAVYDFDIISKIMDEDENSRYVLDVSESELSEMLLKMGTFFIPASKFLTRKNIEAFNRDKTGERLVDDVTDLDSKIYFFSYKPFAEEMERVFDTDEYFSYFSNTLPRSKNDIQQDAELYVRLFNPVSSSYELKDLGIKALVSSFIDLVDIDCINSGVIIDQDHAPENMSTFVGIGMDIKLSAPVRVHISRYALINFLNSIKGNCIVPIYEGADDFASMPSSLILPLSEKHRNVLKKSNKQLDAFSHPNVVSHLAFTDLKHVPEHLKTTVLDNHGKEKRVFVKRYIDLENGAIYKKNCDGSLELFTDEHTSLDIDSTNSTHKKGDDSYEH